MASSSPILVNSSVSTTGFLDKSHVSMVTVGWTDASLPTPFPLVIISCLVSFVLACLGWWTAVTTGVPEEELVPRDKPENWKGMSIRERWRWAWNTTLVDAQILNPTEQWPEKPKPEKKPEQEPMLSAYGGPTARTSRATRWIDTPLTKGITLISLLYNTIRCLFAIVTTLEIVISRNGTHASASTVFLLYISVQTFIANRKLPQLIILILIFDLVCVGIAFLIAAWDQRAKRYGDISFGGGVCPVFAANCTSQAPHWNRTGCGAAVMYTGNYPETRISQFEKLPFYPPYETRITLNSLPNKNVSKLFVMETVVRAIGTIWTAISLPLTIYEAWSVFTSFKNLLHPIPFDKQYKTDKKTGEVTERSGWDTMGIFSFFALAGAIAVLGMTIYGHVKAQTTGYDVQIMDSIGPIVERVNGSMAGGFGSWTDCFVVKTPMSGNGFFREWVRMNKRVAFRLVSLL